MRHKIVNIDFRAAVSDKGKNRNRQRIYQYLTSDLDFVINNNQIVTEVQMINEFDVVESS